MDEKRNRMNKTTDSNLKTVQIYYKDSTWRSAGMLLINNSHCVVLLNNVLGGADVGRIRKSIKGRIIPEAKIRVIPKSRIKKIEYIKLKSS